MTLEEAIGGAFGLSKYVRRGSWPQGSVAIVNVLSTNPRNPFCTTMGHATFVPYNPSNPDDLQADDWHPCDIDGEHPGIDWRGVLSTITGGEVNTAGRGDQCILRLNGHIIEGDWILVWMAPHNLWLSVANEHPFRWLEGGHGPMLRPLSVSANGVDMLFRLHDVKALTCDGDRRLYRLEVTTRDEVPGELTGAAAADGQD